MTWFIATFFRFHSSSPVSFDLFTSAVSVSVNCMHGVITHLDFPKSYLSVQFCGFHMRTFAF